jgi:hypothetical protein
MKYTPKTTRTFRCETSLSNSLDEIADDENLYTSDIIRYALKEYVSYYRENPEDAGMSLQ